VPLERWRLEHRLLRSTPASPDDKTAPRFQHLLRLSYRPNNAFISVSPPPEAKPGTQHAVVTTPNEHFEALYALLTARFTALWTPRARQRIDGTAYTVGEFTVRLGELRQVGGPPTPRGVICYIQADSGIADKETKDATPETPEQTKREDETTRAAMESLWDRIGYPGAKEPSIPDATDGATTDGFNDIRMWCDLLKLRT
jgi:hypothetical protein